jgi:F-type H+-transporting ATPase subunit b
MRTLKSALLLSLATAAPAFAAELKEPPEIFKWLNFFILAGILGYLIAKNLGPALADRSKKIQDDLAAGERAKAEADARAAAVQAKLSDLDFQVSLMRDAAKQDREREADRIRKDGEREIERIQQHAAQDIESAAKLARLDVQRFAAKMAIELAERKVRARMSPEVESALLGSFLDDLSDGASSSKPRQAR